MPTESVQRKRFLLGVVKVSSDITTLCFPFQKLNLINEIKWKNGKPPLDSPRCGFDGEKCIEEFGKLLLLHISSLNYLFKYYALNIFLRR